MHGGRLGDVAKGIGGTLVSSPLDVRGVDQCFESMKHFPATDDLLKMIATDALARTVRSEPDLETSLQYGNYSSITEHIPKIWEKSFDDVSRNRCLLLNRAAAAKVRGIRVSPLAAVGTNIVGITNNFS